jgi:hypothetical protein
MSDNDCSVINLIECSIVVSISIDKGLIFLRNRQPVSREALNMPQKEMSNQLATATKNLVSHIPIVGAAFNWS